MVKSKAVYFTGRQQVEIRTIDIAEPACDEVQIRMLASGICMLEVWNFNHNWNAAKVQGHEGIGVVTRTGESVRSIRVGDYIAGYLPWSERANIKEKDAVRLSTRTVSDAYLVEPLACAINSSYASDIYPGDRAVLFGAGYMGLLLIQMLRYSPLSELIVIDLKAQNLELALQYGADQVINLSDEEGRRQLAALSADSYDLAVECSAAAEALEACTRLVKPGGTINIYAFHHQERQVQLGAWHEKGIQVFNTAPGIATRYFPYRSFQAADRMMASGRIDQSELVTHRYSLQDVSQAMLDSSERRGNMIKSVLLFGEE